MHTFKTLQSEYFYDVNKNAVISISTEVYNYINSLLNEKTILELSNEANQELNNLYKDGYLSANRIKTFEHPKTKYLDDYLSRKLGHLSIQLTQNCNLRCSYCPYTSNNGSNRLHSNKEISLQTIEKGLKLFRDNSLDSQEIVISFYGGEPLLEFDTIVKTVDLSKEFFKGKKIEYAITTNGTAFSEDILNFMEENNFMITISLDGPKEINDSNRKFNNKKDSVFERVIFWIEHIIANYSSLKNALGINMVIDPGKDFARYRQLFTEHPVLNKIRVRASLVDGNYKDEEYVITEDFRNKTSYGRFLAYLNTFGEVDFKDNLFYRYLFGPLISKMMEGFEKAEKLDERFSPSGPCIPGDTKLFLNTEGLFFPCERVSEVSKVNIIGDVVSGLSTERASKVLNISRSQFKNCQNCFAIRGCSNCVRAFDNYENNKDSIKAHCESSRGSFHAEIVAKTIIKEIREL